MASRFPHALEETDPDEDVEDEAYHESSADPVYSNIDQRAFKGVPLEVLLKICPNPPDVRDMQDARSANDVFLIQPFRYSSTSPAKRPIPISPGGYVDRWDERHVRMPCSPENKSRDRKQRWSIIRSFLMELKQSCDHCLATTEELEKTIAECAEQSYDMYCLRHLINEVYSNDQRFEFMSGVLSGICALAINVDRICSESPRLLGIESNSSLTLSQWQAASLLACSFFCLFPRSQGRAAKREHKTFQNPNFNALYQRGPENKISKLQCILNYFTRVVRERPTGVITFRRFALATRSFPSWSSSQKGMAPMHVNSTKKIEELDCTLQVDFANKFIGGGVLRSGCVQEEIRFVLCPEMLVSLLLCEVMQPHECIHLIGCEQYSSYTGYGKTFRFGGDFVDTKDRDKWGRRWSHLVAIDATFFRNPAEQYTQKNITRELIKAYTGFYTQDLSPSGAFSIVTGHWGCGAFNGDRQLKAIIQLMAASEVPRPLIYAAHRDQNFTLMFLKIYDHLITEQAQVRHLYLYLRKYCERPRQISLFDFIFSTPVKSLDS